MTQQEPDYSPEFLVGVCRPVLQISNTDPNLDQNMSSSTPVFRPGACFLNIQ